MAIHAVDSHPKRLAELLFRPFPGRLEFAVRLALICAVTTLVVEIYQTPEPALTTYIVLFLNKPDRGTSLILNIAMLVLISLIIAFIILVAMLVIDWPFWRVTSMTLISLGFLFVASASKLRPIGGTVVLIVAYALDLLGSVHAGELATRALLYAWLFVGIPAGVSIVINLLLAPPPRRLLEGALARRLRFAAEMLRAPDERIRRAFSECIREGNGEVQKWLKFAWVGRTSAPDHIQAIHQATESSAEILMLIDVMDRDPDTAFPPRLRERLARILDAMAAILTNGGYPVGIEFEVVADGEQPLAPRAAEVLAAMREVLISFAERSPADARPPKPVEKSGGFFLADAFSNSEHMHYATKTTTAAMFCYVLYSLLDWPGIHTCLITCYIVSLGTTAETVEKLTLRILGCMLGAAAGIAAIVYLIPSITSIGALMAVVFLSALVSGWIVAGSPRISYAGFQIAFAFFLCAIQGSGPSFDMKTARDRVIGILLGNLVVYVLFTNLWPVSVGKRIDPAIAAILRRLSRMVTETNRSTRRSLALQTQETLSAIEQDLDLAQYEPVSIRPTDGWINVRRRATDEIGAVCGPLLLSVEQDVGFSAAFAGRFTAIADKLDVARVATSLANDGVATGHDADRQGDSPSAQQPFDNAIGRHLRNLEEAVGQEFEKRGEASYVPA
jgi:multidrug resistance protein MdtO